MLKYLTIKSLHKLTKYKIKHKNVFYSKTNRIAGIINILGRNTRRRRRLNAKPSLIFIKYTCKILTKITCILSQILYYKMKLTNKDIMPRQGHTM